MSFNGSGTFQINSSGQPVITGTVISSTAFNALTADLATGLSTCITKDGQTATTVRVPFAFGINSTLTTDATSATTGSIITAGGISMQKALWVGTTSRHVGATQFDAAITYGGITLSNAVTGTGNMVLSASPTLTGTLTAAAITASGTLANSSYFRTGGATDANVVWNLGGTSIATGSGQSAVQIGYTFTSAATAVGNALYAWVRTEAAAFTMASAIGIQIANPSKGAGSAITTNYGLQIDNQTAGATNYAIYTSGGLHYFTGATTCASNVTATYFTATATGPNGLGLAAANTPALYASTTEFMRSTSTQMTLAVPIAITRTVAGALNSVVSTNADTGTGSYATFQARNLTYVSEMAMFGTGWTTSAQYRQNGAIMEANGPGGIVLSASHASGDLFLYNRNTLALTLGASQAATFASSVTATLFTPTATGNNGLGLAAANTPAFYASTTEVLRATTGTITAAIYFAMNAQADVTSTVSTDYAIAIKNQATTGNNVFVTWYTDSNTSRGTVTFNRGAGLVAYNTTSDYRLKDLFGRYATSGETIDAIPVHLGKMKGATMERPMFVAHEVQVVAPYAVTGLKDAIDANGDILSQQLDNSTLVPALWAEVQSLRNRVRSLETAK